MPVVSNDFSDIVYNRRSIRNFDPSVKIPREELLEKLNRRKKNYEIRLQNLSSDLFLNQKGKVVFENCLKQDILMYKTFIEALEKQ